MLDLEKVRHNKANGYCFEGSNLTILYLSSCIEVKRKLRKLFSPCKNNKNRGGVSIHLNLLPNLKPIIKFRMRASDLPITC